MAFLKKRRIVGFSAAILVLVSGVGTYELWMNAAVRARPWQLEAYVDMLAADCRPGPGAYAFGKELQALAAQVDEAKRCLSAAGDAWVIRRNYSPCVQRLWSASLAAVRIRMGEALRFQELKARLDIALKTLEVELGNDNKLGKEGAKFEIRNYSQSQARTRLEAARNLAALGQTESALNATLHARAAWAQSENFVAAELARYGDTQRRALWEKQAQDLLRWTRQTGRSAILVDKLEHHCLLLADGRVEKAYVANLSRNWYRMKVQEHDASTPEGEYRIKRKLPSSSFGFALLLDYPNAADWQRFDSMKKRGEIAPRARIGGTIEIHGGGRLNSDWTDGCVSLENADMADLYKRAYVGMPVTIVGTSTIGGKL